MLDSNDVQLPIDALAVTSDGGWTLEAGSSDQLVLIGLLTHTLKQAAAELVTPDRIELVSIAVDATGKAMGGAVKFAHQIDRQTRTLIFISGDVRESEEPLLRGTAIFRLVPEAR
ncbi:MAG: hypothetical protein AAGJ84_07595 [Pseudomonadota bacterium]